VACGGKHESYLEKKHSNKDMYDWKKYEKQSTHQ
jgi:hypothetical protein